MNEVEVERERGRDRQRKCERESERCERKGKVERKGESKAGQKNESV